jgi:uncharacterized protein (DUF433 family)
MVKPTAKRTTRTAVKHEPTEVGKYLVVHPGVCHGKMTFRGTRVPVETILLYLATGHSFEYLRQSWPEVSAEAIEEAVKLATDAFLDHYRSRRQ